MIVELGHYALVLALALMTVASGAHWQFGTIQAPPRRANQVIGQDGGCRRAATSPNVTTPDGITRLHRHDPPSRAGRRRRAR